jgi:hypothetical protein
MHFHVPTGDKAEARWSTNGGHMGAGEGRRSRRGIEPTSRRWPPRRSQPRTSRFKVGRLSLARSGRSSRAVYMDSEVGASRVEREATAMAPFIHHRPPSALPGGFVVVSNAGPRRWWQQWLWVGGADPSPLSLWLRSGEEDKEEGER